MHKIRCWKYIFFLCKHLHEMAKNIRINLFLSCSLSSCLCLLLYASDDDHIKLQALSAKIHDQGTIYLQFKSTFTVNHSISLAKDCHLTSCFSSFAVRFDTNEGNILPRFWFFGWSISSSQLDWVFKISSLSRAK